MSGTVVNNETLALPKQHYDCVIIGGGVLGLCCAFYMRQYHPEKSLLLIEQEGIPSELGATFVSPAIVHSLFLNPDSYKKAKWSKHLLKNLSELTGVNRPHNQPYFPVGYAKFMDEHFDDSLTTEEFLESRTEIEQQNIQALLDLSYCKSVRFDADGGYASAENVAQHFGYAAVREGADLLLNARATFTSPQSLTIERLSYNNKMQQEVVMQETLSFAQCIVAAGHSSGAVLEGLGEIVDCPKVYMQYPKVEGDKQLLLGTGVNNAGVNNAGVNTIGRLELPVISYQGFHLRPQANGLLVVPPSLPADSIGYQPTEGKLMGVQVGLRREIIDSIMENLDSFPCFAWESFNLGKAVRQVRGAWQIAYEQPAWHKLKENKHVYLLHGGREAMSLGLATAHELAQSIEIQ